MSDENFIERGCSLQNTDWIVGVAVYTGPDSKMMLNGTQGRIKHSKVERSMNRYVILVFMFLLIQCIFASSYSIVWYENSKLDYLEIGTNDPEYYPLYNFFIRIAMWFLLLGNCVPISLLVSLEMVKFL